MLSSLQRQSANLAAMILLAALAPLGITLAQAGPVPLGTRVRVATVAPPASASWIVGELETNSRTDITIVTAGGERRRILHSDISRMQQSRGIRSQSLIGFGIGAGAGAFLGIVLHSTACSGDGRSSACMNNAYRYIGLAGIGGIAGLLVGTMVHAEKWTDVSLGWEGRVRLGPTGLTIRF